MVYQRGSSGSKKVSTDYKVAFTTFAQAEYSVPNDSFYRLITVYLVAMEARRFEFNALGRKGRIEV